MQLQYKAENSGSWAFRLKSVSIRKLDFAKDIKGTPRKKRDHPEQLGDAENEIELLMHHTKFKLYTAILRAAVPLSW